MIILRLLRFGESYPLKLVADSKGVIKANTVYITLNSLADSGLVDSRQQDPPPLGFSKTKRRFFRITYKGACVLAAVERLYAVLTD